MGSNNSSHEKPSDESINIDPNHYYYEQVDSIYNNISNPNKPKPPRSSRGHNIDVYYPDLDSAYYEVSNNHGMSMPQKKGPFYHDNFSEYAPKDFDPDYLFDDNSNVKIIEFAVVGVNSNPNVEKYAVHGHKPNHNCGANCPVCIGPECNDHMTSDKDSDLPTYSRWEMYGGAKNKRVKKVVDNESDIDEDDLNSEDIVDQEDITTSDLYRVQSRIFDSDTETEWYNNTYDYQKNNYNDNQNNDYDSDDITLTDELRSVMRNKKSNNHIFDSEDEKILDTSTWTEIMNRSVNKSKKYLQ